MRSRPSPADENLRAQLAEHGFVVSQGQLERWRSRGLLARARVVRESFGGSVVLSHPQETFEVAAFLAEVTAQGRPWQYAAMDLFDAGGDLSSAALRATALFLIELQLKHLRRAWERAEAIVPSRIDPDDELADLGHFAAQFSPRSVRRIVRDEVATAHPYMSASELRTAAERALVWRLVDVHLPGRMNEEQRNLARHGVEEPMDPFGQVGIFPLPSERLACAKTLTWAEASTFRGTALLLREDQPDPADLRTFTLMTWIVTAARINEDPDAPDRPLTQARLEGERLAVAEAQLKRDVEHTPAEASH